MMSKTVGGRGIAWVGAFLSILVLASPVHAQAPPTPGSIAGTVTDTKGQPVAAVVVRLIGVAPLSSNSTRPDRTGAFTFAKVVPGRYRLCLTDPAGVYADPCVWTPFPPVINLTAGQAQTGVRMLAPRSATVSVRLEDPGRLVDSKTPAGATRTLALTALLPNGMVWPMREVSKNATGKDFQVRVAEGVPVRFRALSPLLDVQDHTGAAIHGKEGNSEVRGDAERAAPLSLTFRVTGGRN